MKCFQPNKVPIKEPLKDSVSPLGAISFSMDVQY
jgi:hypothetical protein